MSDWFSALANMNAAELSTFGETVTYDPQNNAPAFSLQVIRDMSQILEPGAPGEYIRIWFRAADVPGGPMRGDSVTLSGGGNYRVTHDIKAEVDGGIWVICRQS